VTCLSSDYDKLTEKEPKVGWYTASRERLWRSISNNIKPYNECIKATALGAGPYRWFCSW